MNDEPRGALGRGSALGEWAMQRRFMVGIMATLATCALACYLTGCGREKPEERGQAHLAPARDISRRLDEQLAAQARFAAMTPAEHLAAAREKVADTTQNGVAGMDEATRHLVAIPHGTVERHAADALAREINRRIQRAHETEERARAAQGRAQLAEARQHRETYANGLDQNFIRRGIEVDNVRVAGPDGTTLRIRYALCGRVFVDRFVRGNREELVGMGFRRVECNSSFENAWMEL